VPGLIFHSNRGSQYCSHECQAALAAYAMRASMHSSLTYVSPMQFERRWLVDREKRGRMTDSAMGCEKQGQDHDYLSRLGR